MSGRRRKGLGVPAHEHAILRGRRQDEFHEAVGKVAQQTLCTRAFTDALADADIAYGRLRVHADYLAGGEWEELPRKVRFTMRTLRSLRNRHMKCLVKKNGKGRY